MSELDYNDFSIIDIPQAYENGQIKGWVPPEDRDYEQKNLHDQNVLEMPEFKIVGFYNEDKEKAVLWDCSKQVNGGRHFTTFRQVTGSCVGNGLGQAVWYLSAVEIIRLGDLEEALLPFYLIPYGRSRFYSGMRGRGDGSTGSGAAKAIRVDGIVEAKLEGLPKYDDSNGITWGQSEEMRWSDGASISEEWLSKSRKHLVKTAALIKSVDEARAALQNYYPLTIASNWGGQMQPRAQGSPEILLNSRATTWNHQMCVIGYWKHPQFGNIYYILNSWSPTAHGQPPDDSPPGGFWVKEAELAYIIRQDETFALSQFDGFPANPIDEKFFNVIRR